MSAQNGAKVDDESLEKSVEWVSTKEDAVTPLSEKRAEQSIKARRLALLRIHKDHDKVEQILAQTGQKNCKRLFAKDKQEKDESSASQPEISAAQPFLSSNTTASQDGDEEENDNKKEENEETNVHADKKQRVDSGKSKKNDSNKSKPQPEKPAKPAKPNPGECSCKPDTSCEECVAFAQLYHSQGY